MKVQIFNKPFSNKQVRGALTDAEPLTTTDIVVHKRTAHTKKSMPAPFIGSDLIDFLLKPAQQPNYNIAPNTLFIAKALNLPPKVNEDIITEVFNHLPSYGDIIGVALSRMSPDGQEQTLAKQTKHLNFIPEVLDSSQFSYLSELSEASSAVSALQSGREDALFLALILGRLPLRLVLLFYPSVAAKFTRHQKIIFSDKVPTFDFQVHDKTLPRHLEDLQRGLNFNRLRGSPSQVTFSQSKTDCVEVEGFFCMNSSNEIVTKYSLSYQRITPKMPMISAPKHLASWAYKETQSEYSLSMFLDAYPVPLTSFLAHFNRYHVHSEEQGSEDFSGNDAS